jgi:hypothetical protein
LEKNPNLQLQDGRMLQKNLNQLFDKCAQPSPKVLRRPRNGVSEITEQTCSPPAVKAAPKIGSRNESYQSISSKEMDNAQCAQMVKRKLTEREMLGIMRENKRQKGVETTASSVESDRELISTSRSLFSGIDAVRDPKVIRQTYAHIQFYFAKAHQFPPLSMYLLESKRLTTLHARVHSKNRTLQASLSGGASMLNCSLFLDVSKPAGVSLTPRPVPKLSA